MDSEEDTANIDTAAEGVSADTVAASDAPLQLALNEAGTTASDAPLRLAQAETGSVSGVAAGATAKAPDAVGAKEVEGADGMPLWALLGGGAVIAAAGGAGTTPSLSIDIVAPTATLTAAALANNGSATVQSSETGTAYLVKNTLAVTSLSDITGADGALWNSVVISTANSDTSLSVADLNAGVYKLYTTDAAGNLSAVATNTVVISNTATTIINLTDSGVTGDEGNLIAPVQVEGAWYYHWDRSGDGTTLDEGGADYTTHNVLDEIFKATLAEVNAGQTGTGTDTTDLIRYATLNGVKVALPTANGGVTYPQGINAYQNGTAYTDEGASSNGTTSSFNELLAIWDAYNGTGTNTDIKGVPTGWQASDYWSATPSASGHANVNLNNGFTTRRALAGFGVDPRKDGTEYLPVDDGIEPFQGGARFGKTGVAVLKVKQAVLHDRSVADRGGV